MSHLLNQVIDKNGKPIQAFFIAYACYFLPNKCETLPLSVLFPSVLWLKLLRYIRINADIAARYGFEILLKPIPT